MDFIKFTYDTVPTVLEDGERINGIQNSMWVERYSEPGEFEFDAPLSSGLKQTLPVGSLISHADTLEVMLVENHEIFEKTTDDPTIKITGRSFVSYLENRPIGLNLARASSTISDYTLSSDYSWNQIVQIINDHIRDTTDTYDGLFNVEAITTATPPGISGEARTIDRGNVWERVADLLSIDGVGIKTQRPNPSSGGVSETQIVIYQGSDLTSQVIFSLLSGDLDQVNYLFTDKAYKNSALVLGRYIWHMVDLSAINFDRRIMVVPGDDIDGHLNAVPTGATLTSVLAAMETRGKQALYSQNKMTITQNDISPRTDWRYRRDYNLGDFILLEGNFGESQVMRVTEYAEIEDENGESGHPTLAFVEA